MTEGEAIMEEAETFAASHAYRDAKQVERLITEASTTDDEAIYTVATEVQRMMGHRHITTTERYLHYAPDADGSAKLTELWGDRSVRDGSTPPSRSANVVPLRRAA